MKKLIFEIRILRNLEEKSFQGFPINIFMHTIINIQAYQLENKQHSFPEYEIGNSQTSLRLIYFEALSKFKYPI